MELGVPRAILEAASQGEFGRVIKLARQGRGQSQSQLGTATGYSQSAISRIESGAHQAYDVRVLRAIAGALDIPQGLFGLADAPYDPQQQDRSPVNRRCFLLATTAVAASSAIPHELEWAGEGRALRQITAMQRRLDGYTPSRELAGLVVSHLRLAKARFVQAADPLVRQHLAAAISEVAGFAGWLHWDMHDLGSARGYYGQAVQAARDGNDPTLVAYMLGSLASFSLDEGDVIGAFSLLTSARKRLGGEAPAVAEAWLGSLAAQAYAAAGQEKQAWSALDLASTAVARIPHDEPAPWPWVFAFDQRKVARQRLACAVLLGRPHEAEAAASDADVDSVDHTKQRALLLFDLASADLQVGQVDRALHLAASALDLADESRSARVIDRARRFRREIRGPVPAEPARHFDDRLRAAAMRASQHT